jgi:hypothetical protein
MHPASKNNKQKTKNNKTGEILMQVLVPRLMASFVFVLLTVLFTQQTQAAFFTPGQFDVGPSGAASYTVPIAVPPGTGGMAPSLALAYNSQGGNGLLGMGWNLSGLSAITRCPQTLVQDGIKAGINYDANDKYCLDGQRLVAISGGYGANATEYRTEGESYSRIISYGGNGYGPQWFEVWTKSGQIIEFGNTADSAIEAQGKVAIRVWAVNKVSDTKGNYLTVTYTEDNPNGQYYPSHIDYTGNATAGLVPYNSVQFIYAARPDITPMYDGGSLIKNTVRLSNVQTHAQVNGADTVVKDYRLSYDVSAATQRSRITQVQECDGFAATANCLQPTRLGWQDGNDGSFTKVYAQANYPVDGSIWRAGADATQTFPMDVNGDGKTDLVQIMTNTYQAQVLLSNGNGSFTKVYAQANYPVDGLIWRAGVDAAQTFPMDVNGDGKTDLVQIMANAYQAQVLQKNGPLSDLIVTATNGLGASTSITYKPLTDASVYTKESTGVYPVVDVQAPMYVVSQVSSSNGIGGNYVSNYSYVGAKSHLSGGGFLGFRQTISTDAQTGIVSTTTYRQDYPYQGLPLAAEKRTSSSVLLNSVANTWAATTNPAWGSQYHAPQLTQSVESSYELDGGLVSLATTTTVYDAYGNPTSITVSTPDGYSKTTTNTYVNDAVNWYLGRLSNAAVVSTSP